MANEIKPREKEGMNATVKSAMVDDARKLPDDELRRKFVGLAQQVGLTDADKMRKEAMGVVMAERKINPAGSLNVDPNRKGPLTVDPTYVARGPAKPKH